MIITYVIESLCCLLPVAYQAWDYYLLLPPVVHMLRGWDNGQYKAHDQAIENYRRTADTIIDRARSFPGRAKFLPALLEMKESGKIGHSELQQMVMEMLLAGERVFD